MLVITVNRVVHKKDQSIRKKRIVEERERHKGSLPPPRPPKKRNTRNPLISSGICDINRFVVVDS
jgi:hypothetical protein